PPSSSLFPYTTLFRSYVALGARPIPCLFVDWRQVAVRAPGNAALLGNGPQTRVYGHSDSSAVVMGKRPITSIFLDRGTLVHGPRHHEMGMDLYSASCVQCDCCCCPLAVGKSLIPSIHVYWASLG